MLDRVKGTGFFKDSDACPKQRKLDDLQRSTYITQAYHSRVLISFGAEKTAKPASPDDQHMSRLITVFIIQLLCELV